jgi:hypothetical protein
MYLTSMLVRNTAHDWRGTNAHLYEEPTALVSISPSAKTRQLLELADLQIKAARKLRASKIAVPSVGNAVDAYLDVIVAGDLSIESFDRIADRTRRELETPTAAEAIAWADSGVLVAVFIGRGQDLAGTFEKLSATAKELLSNPRLEQAPLRIKELREGSGASFELDQDSADRLRVLHGQEWVPGRITISDDVRDALREIHGDFYKQLELIMTGGIDEVHLVRLGGVEIYDAQGNVRPRR